MTAVVISFEFNYDKVSRLVNAEKINSTPRPIPLSKLLSNDENTRLAWILWIGHHSNVVQQKTLEISALTEAPL